MPFKQSPSDSLISTAWMQNRPDAAALAQLRVLSIMDAYLASRSMPESSIKTCGLICDRVLKNMSEIMVL